ncbi:hypothetical protein [Endozoicomonas ascidiicola]|uniref:hypothetical protein n=1 Tax=Endozoicomonas ascidiicola TaxID=1698521 RepID=UPI000833E5BC|nr:hypothetical protein [Endozoicomonas ascidiicola]
MLNHKSKIFILYTDISLRQMYANFKKYQVSTVFIAVMVVSHPVHANLERRMAIEIDNHAVHFAIADVNTDTEKIYRHLDNGSKKYSFSNSIIPSEGGELSTQSITELQQIFQQLRRRKDHFKVKKVRAVAQNDLGLTSNEEALKKRVARKSNINIKILTDEERDQVDFFSLMSLAERSQKLSALVIGSSSIDIVIASPDIQLASFRIQTGSFSFISYLIEVVQKKPPKHNNTLTPISTHDIQLGINYSRYLLRRIPDAIRDQLDGQTVYLLLNKPMTENPEFINEYQDEKTVQKSTLQSYLNSEAVYSTGKNQKGQHPDQKLANAIIMLGFMEEFDIQSFHLAKRNSTIDMLEYPVFWH